MSLPIGTASAMSRRALLKATAGVGAAAAAGALGACSTGDTGSGARGTTSTHAAIALPPEVPGPHYKQGYKGPRTRELKPFADALVDTPFATVTGEVRFNARHELATNPYRMLVWDGAAFVEPPATQ